MRQPLVKLLPSNRACTDGSPASCCRHQPDGEDQWDGSLEQNDPDQLDGNALKQLVLKAGVVGLGGATFPAHVKLSPPPPEKNIDTLILNGVECEPFLTADHQLMLEESERIIDGINILRKILGIETAIIGIEANKPDAIEKLTAECAPPTILEFKPLRLNIHKELRSS